MMITQKENQIDHFKMVGDWALAAGRFLQSKQTGYVHYYSNDTQEPYRTIPLVENTLFALALLRSRLVEQVQEAKVILKGLLAFQNLTESDSYGNFPVYLHEFPHCADSTMGLQLAAPFYWILHHFGHVLGTSLKQQLEEAARLGLENCLESHKIKPFPYSIAVRLAAAQFAFGVFWNKEEWKCEGKEQLEQLSERQLEGWNSTKHLGDLLIGLQMAYPSLANSHWQALWQRMEQTWHPQTASYIGPCVREWQEGEEPMPNLYDLFGGYFAGQFSRRATLLRPYHLYGALIQSSADKFQLNSSSTQVVQNHYKLQAWKSVSSAEKAYTLLEKKEPCNPSIDKTFTPFRLIWGNLQALHSLVCQGVGYEKVEFSEEGNTLKLSFDLPLNLPEGEKHQKRELEFFVDCQPEIYFTLNGNPSNTFSLGQELMMHLGAQRVSLVLDLLEGEGDFMGHVMRGNRPSQIDHKGETRFHAYDWTIFLRTIRRTQHCRLTAALTLLPEKS